MATLNQITDTASMTNVCRQIDIPFLERVTSIEQVWDTGVRFVFTFRLPWEAGSTNIERVLYRPNYGSIINNFYSEAQSIKAQVCSMVEEYYATSRAAKPNYARRASASPSRVFHMEKT